MLAKYWGGYLYMGWIVRVEQLVVVIEHLGLFDWRDRPTSRQKGCAHENLPTHLPTHQKSIGSHSRSHTTFGRQTDSSGQRSSFDQTIDCAQAGAFLWGKCSHCLQNIWGGYLYIGWICCTEQQRRTSMRLSRVACSSPLTLKSS